MNFYTLSTRGRSRPSQFSPCGSDLLPAAEGPRRPHPGGLLQRWRLQAEHRSVLDALWSSPTHLQLKTTKTKEPSGF